PVIISTLLTPEQADAYALNVRIAEITQKLTTDDVLPKGRPRSPSPPPIYDKYGKRTNTRVARYKSALEDERHKLIGKALRTVPGFKPPPNYVRPLKIQHKLYIPVRDYPGVNFIGLVLGPRGNQLKKMQAESGAKIQIRGKGSVKDGKEDTRSSNANEDLHCLITADTDEQIEIAISLLDQIIATAASTPEYQNTFKRDQLRELAVLNGTLRETSNDTCSNCGMPDHRRAECPENNTITNSIICRVCGNPGHIARDCKERTANNRQTNFNTESNHYDDEYQRLLNELDKPASERSAAAETKSPSVPDSPTAQPPLPPAPPGSVQPPPSLPPGSLPPLPPPPATAQPPLPPAPP
ncbi:hypothetical protein CANCADRAFT_19902, partial [Tortispora caseinolytica NRRL Y-17796]